MSRRHYSTEGDLHDIEVQSKTPTTGLKPIRFQPHLYFKTKVTTNTRDSGTVF